MWQLLPAEELRSTAYGRWTLSRVLGEGKKRVLRASRTLSEDEKFEEFLKLLNQQRADVLVSNLYVPQFGGLIHVRSVPQDPFITANLHNDAAGEMSLQKRISINVDGLCICSAPGSIQKDWLKLPVYEKIHFRVEVYPGSLSLNDEVANTKGKV